ncbi:MAG: MmcQ/YjbR family DNA-binding protein [Microthrixaceae bacterium]
MSTTPATVDDVHRFAAGMPHVDRRDGPKGNAVYAVGGKSFVFFRNPRADAVDPETGERYDDVIVFWVEDEHEKRALVDDPATPFFATDHFDGHPSVLLLARRLDEVSLDQIEELVAGAWLAQASKRRGDAWLAQRGAR